MKLAIKVRGSKMVGGKHALIEKRIVFESNPDDHEAMHNLFLVKSDCDTAHKENRGVVPPLLIHKLWVVEAKFLERLQLHAPKGWTVVHYECLDQ